MIMRFWNKLPAFLRNRYAISILVFVFWLAFFDQHNLINQIELRSELYQLETDKEYYFNEIIEIREDLDELLSDNAKLEKFAREKYFMKKANEEIFVFTEKE
ncbi:MAG: aspartyl-phosphate phosphatase Spo0E family protein [Salibacteraceae bacterium]|jgi:cell division protein DivIC|nr:aspartyl-phosphate phosphatase Spo0E family protein [Salibacteraceae bacterium]MDP4763020.1 aspartyl-phosphate phosphatase Spo0E family protein [Salibacteraceae bacterium]MDP4964021.1 aspartyl-phosphate phosphatase Spo0E family protein [Salibacteraceae bacterium]